MESIKIIEAIIIAAFIFPALSVLIIILLVIFTHIYFHRSNLASSFYEQATREKIFFLKNAVYNSGLISSSWDRFRFIVKWCLNEDYIKEDSIQAKQIKKCVFILNMVQLLCFPLSLLWVLLCLITVAITIFLI